MLQPHLANTHISLRPLLAADREALYAVAADPLIWEQHPYHDRWQRPVFDRFFDDAIASGGALVAQDPETGEIIGSSRFDISRAGKDEIEIGWTFLARSHWGTKANPAMKALMLTHAFKFFPCVMFIIGATNHRSRRAIEKIGGVLTPRTDTFHAAGQLVSHVTYAIDCAAFKAGPIAHLA
jgi:RimJ/RimL family protein N-acetyltransferase